MAAPENATRGRCEQKPTPLPHHVTLVKTWMTETQPSHQANHLTPSVLVCSDPAGFRAEDGGLGNISRTFANLDGYSSRDPPNRDEPSPCQRDNAEERGWSPHPPSLRLQCYAA